MSVDKKKMTVDEVNSTLEEALIRLERAVLSKPVQDTSDATERAIYIEQLEQENKKLTRSLDEMKKHCIALKNGYEMLEDKCARLEKANDSAERELANTLQDLDQIIAQKSLH